MWTRLVAGAAAHDINNLAQGLSNLLSLAAASTASRESLERYGALAHDAIDELRQLGGDLLTVANASAEGEVQHLGPLVGEAVAELDAPRDRSIDVSPPSSRTLVRAPSAALRLAIQSVVRYAAAASEPGGRVTVSASREAATAVVVVAAPSATAPHAEAEAEIGGLLSGAEREFGGDAGLVLAGAAAHLCGGVILAGPAEGGGVRFKLCFPCIDDGP